MGHPKIWSFEVSPCPEDDPGLFRCGDGFGDAVNGLEFGVAAGTVTVDEDGERKGLAAVRCEVAGESVDLVERAGFSPETALERRVFEAVAESAVHACYGKGASPGGAPGLTRGCWGRRRPGPSHEALCPDWDRMNR